MKLRRIRLEHFKRFGRIEIDLHDFQLLVGPNNSGKTSVLQGCALLDFCYRQCVERKNGELHFKNRSLSPDEFSVIPAASPRDLWLNRRLDSGGKLIELGISGVFQNGASLGFHLTFQHNRFGIAVDAQDGAVPAPDKFGIALIPGFAGFLPQEEKRTPAIRRDLRAHGQHGTIIRNILLDLKLDDARWKRFVAIVGRVFPQIRLNEPEFDEQVDRYIKVTYLEDEVSHSRKSRTRLPQFDVFAAGSGFHQFVQIFASALAENATTILLDEPDAHLFGRLQSELYGVLMDLTREGLQIVAATHSTELIAAADPHQIISFANGAPARLRVAPEMLSVVDRLSTPDNLSLLMIDATKRIIVVESKSDEQHLRRWLQQVLGAEHAAVLRRLVFLHANRRPTGDDVNLMLNALGQAFRVKSPGIDVRALVIADRDYASSSDRTAELAKYHGPSFSRQTWHVWERNEIENYLVVPRAIAAAVEKELSLSEGPLLTANTPEIVEWIEQIVESDRDQIVGRVMNRIKRSEPNLEPSTMLSRARERVDAAWVGEARYALVDAKDVLFPQIRSRIHDKYDLNVSDSAIFREIADSEIASELQSVCRMIQQFVGT